MTKGRLNFHSETGTEGGWYAWQDNAFIWTKDNHCPTHGQTKYAQPPGYYCPAEQSKQGECWSYDGLRYLNNGDHLKVFVGGEVLWEGDVLLNARTDVYVNPDAEVYGFWVNQEPDPSMGVDRLDWARWFFDGLECEVS